MLSNDAARESRLRHHLRKQNLLLRKSRVRNAHYNNEGGYMIVDGYRNYVVVVSRFECDLDDIEEFLNDWMQSLSE